MMAAFQSNIYIKSHLILRYLIMIALLALLLCVRAQHKTKYVVNNRDQFISKKQFSV